MSSCYVQRFADFDRNSQPGPKLLDLPRINIMCLPRDEFSVKVTFSTKKDENAIKK
jgi:hypothetical protein